MYTIDDLVDAIVEQLIPLFAGGSEPIAVSTASLSRKQASPRQKKRVFLTEYEIKKALTLGANHLTISKDAIISPLALDWLELKGVRIVRE